MLLLPLNSVDVGDRLREVDDDFARVIADSIAEHGQMTPVEVRAVPGAARPYALIAGAHRMRALELAGQPEVLAAVFVGSEIQARLREIDENLVRHELTELDRATFLARRKELYEAIHPDSRHGGARGQGKSPNLATCFSLATAERLRVSERWVSRAVWRHNRLHADVRRRIAGTWLADHGAQLDLLAKSPASEQMQAVDLLFGVPAGEAGTPRTVRDALDQVRGVVPVAPSPEERMFQGFLRLWRLAPAGVRRRMRAWIKSEGEA